MCIGLNSWEQGIGAEDMYRKLFACVTAAIIFALLFSACTLEGDITADLYGKGTKDDPFRVATPADLQRISTSIGGWSKVICILSRIGV